MIPQYRTSQYIACYYAYKDEFSTTLLMEMIWRDNKQCYLPVIDENKQLEFFRYDEGARLKENRYGIPEPLQRDGRKAAAELDLVILPLLAFDGHGNRLGTGGGYYDRTFADLREREVKKPFMLGVGYACQQTDNLPVDVWDISLDGVLTEKGYFYHR